MMKRFNTIDLLSPAFMLSMIALAVVLTCSSVATGALVDVIISGTVNAGSGLGGINDGDSVTVSYVYDDSLAPTASGTNNADYPGVTLNYLTIGAFNYAGTGDNQQVVEYGGGGDSYFSDWMSMSGPLQDGLAMVGLKINLSGPSSALPGFTPLPTTAQLQSLNSSRTGSAYFNDEDLPGINGLSARAIGPGRYETVYFTFDSTQIVPEPASMLLLGLGGLAVARRKKQG